jgi:two-component system nitrate/nitrite response regulator NarL
MSSPISLYLIDDHTIFSQSFGAYVATRPDFVWKGSAKGDGRVVQQVLRLNPTVVLLDFHLGVFNGFYLLEQLRDKGFLNFVILLTMNRDRVVIEAARHQGANGFVTKEVDGEELMLGIIQLVKGEIPYLELLGNADTPVISPFGLTPQEKLIADLVCSGLSTEDIALKLEISIHTVHTHRRRILGKTKSENFMQVCQKLS